MSYSPDEYRPILCRCGSLREEDDRCHTCHIWGCLDCLHKCEASNHNGLFCDECLTLDVHKILWCKECLKEEE